MGEEIHGGQLKTDQAKPGPPSFPFEKGNGNFKPVLSDSISSSS